MLAALIVYTLAAFGTAWIVGHARITLALRAWLAMSRSHVVLFFVDLAECPACFGTWFGLAAGLALPGYVSAVLGVTLPRALVPFVVAAYTAGANYCLGRATGIIPAPGAEPEAGTDG